MIKAVIFDLDGTLVNAYGAVSSSVNFCLKKLGVPPRSKAEITRAVGMGDQHLLAHFIGAEKAETAIQFYRAHHDKALAAKGGVRFLPEAKQLLSTLRKKGYHLAIATNRPEKFTAIILKALDAKQYFDLVYCADKFPNPKPHPQMLNAIVKRLKIAKKEAIYVGDMDIDMRAGKRAGIKTIGVVTGSCTAQELKILKPERIITRIGKIKELIKELSDE